MKLKEIINTWRSFLTEEVVYSGILKIKPKEDILSQLESMQSFLPEEAKRLNSDDLHLTLVHQSILKPFEEQLKKIELPEPPGIELSLDAQVIERKSPGKKSWAVKVDNQEEMREYVKNIMEMLGSPNTNPEPERVFHISLANLSGNPHDSVR